MAAQVSLTVDFKSMWATLARPSFWEWRGGERVAGWLWPALLVLLVAPFPYANWPLVERAMPIMWLMVGGGVWLMTRVASASWPFAALMAWALLRAAMMGMPVRAIQLLFLLGMVGLLYVGARFLPARAAAWAPWALCVGAAYEFAFGYINLWRFYPFMSFVLPDQMGRPMAFLTHPNYFGSYMALVLPIIWSVGGTLPALAVYLLILSSVSGGPVIAASVAVAVLLGPPLPKAWRYGVVGAISAAVSVVMTLHEWRLSGRLENWQAIWPELMRYPIIGQGLGSWRMWADNYNTKTRSIFATLQAHNEPYQLWFELGLIGLLFAACWAFQAFRASRVVWQRSNRTWTADFAWQHGIARSWWRPGWIALDRAWIGVLVAGVVNSLGSPTFHLPAQAAIVLFALARIQAAATPEPIKDVLEEATVNGNKVVRLTRPQRRERGKVAA